MKICLVHNSYEQPGGEDVVFEQEKENLERAGHAVIVYHRSNTETRNFTPLARIKFTKDMIWSSCTRQEFSQLLDREYPDLVHVHNTFFVISPSIYSACKERGVPVVQTLHNFRWLCPAYTFYRDGHICEDCLHGSLWSGIHHACYRDSRLATAGLAAILAWHRVLQTWNDSIDCYIALTEFSRRKFIAAGLDRNKMLVKPNFVRVDPGQSAEIGDYALFVGRLSEEKGLKTLLDAWARLDAAYPLQIIGDGPDRAALEGQAHRQNISGVTFRGSISRAETLEAMKGARFLIVPSLWYEGFPMVIAEAFACGRAVICSRLGAMEEIVADAQTGLHFAPGDPEDLSRKVSWAWTHPEEIRKLGCAARCEFERRYTAQRNYGLLMNVYETACRQSRSAFPATASQQPVRP